MIKKICAQFNNQRVLETSDPIRSKWTCIFLFRVQGHLEEAYIERFINNTAVNTDMYIVV